MDTNRLKNILAVLSKLPDNYTCSLVLHTPETEIVLDGSASTPDIQAEFQYRLTTIAEYYIGRLKADLALELSKPSIAQTLYEQLEERLK